MANAVTAITTAVTAQSLWDSFSQLAPYFALIIPVAIGIYYFRKLLKGTSKLRFKI